MSDIPKGMKFSLKAAREIKGLKQSESAKKIGISTDTLGNYDTENRRNLWSIIR